MIKHDARYALRTLAANPGFAAVAVLSLGFGIGANIAIFSLLNNVVFSALPVRDPSQLVVLSDPGSSGVGIGSQRGERSLLTYAEFLQLRDHATAFSAVMASQSGLEQVQARVEGGEPEDLSVRMVSGEYFATLGVHASMGRTFGAEDADIEGMAPYAVISHQLWQRRFGASRDVLGKQLTIQNGVFSIVGVMPPAFFGETVGERPDVWVPLGMQAAVLPGRDWLHDPPDGLSKVMWLHVFGRLKPGKTIEEAQAEANVIFQQGLIAFYGSAPTAEARKRLLDQRLRVRPAASGASTVRVEFADPLRMLLGAAAVVLLIACANLGNLLLSRTTARSREVAIRLALGASRSRLFRQLLTEGACLAVLGGLLGITAAYVLRAALIQLVSDDIVLPGGVDIRVLTFAFALTCGAGLLIGALPAWRATSTDPAAGLKEQARGFAGSVRWQRVSRFVVVVQLALSLPLLLGAGLLMRTLYNLQQVDLGFERERLLLLRVDAQTGGYPEAARLPLFERLRERLESIPSVRAVTYSSNGLFTGNDARDEVEVERYMRRGDGDRVSRYDHIGPQYFSALRIPVTAGREITDSDTPGGLRVCVVNEAFSKRFFEGRSPLGLHVTQVFGTQRNTYQVVGVARDSRSNQLRGDVEPRFFVPVAQPVEVPNDVTFLVRTTGDASAATDTLRREVQQLVPALPITMVRSLEDLVDGRLVQDRLLSRLSLAFGVLGLLLSAIGLYGVLSYGVVRRTNEIGIRKALGARNSAVIGMVLGETGVLLVIGMLGGAALSILALRLIASRLYGLAALDPLAIAGSILVLGTVALAATAIPAYRASRIDPLVALRQD